MRAVANILHYHQQEIIKVKNIKVMGVDLAREERLQKIDAIIMDFEELSRNQRFIKCASRKGEVGVLSK